MMQDLWRRFRLDRGEITSWLLVAAFLTAAAAAASGPISEFIDCQVQTITGEGPTSCGPEAREGNDDPPPETGDEPGTPPQPEPEPEPEPEPAPEPHPICGDPVHIFAGAVCDANGECASFSALACSESPMARMANTEANYWERCTQTSGSLLLCHPHNAAIEATIAALLRDNIGIDPEGLHRAAAQACHEGSIACHQWVQLADFVTAHREVIAAAGIANVILPGPPGLACLIGIADGSMNNHDLTGCVLSLA